MIDVETLQRFTASGIHDKYRFDGYAQDDEYIQYEDVKDALDALVAECDALQLRVDHFEQVAANSPDPESPLIWEAMQLVAAQKSEELRKMTAERDALLKRQQ